MEKSKKMAIKVASLFYKDFQWKLLALALAFILWFVGVNVTNPIQTHAYDNLSLNILGRDQLIQNNLVLLNEQQLSNTPITVSIRATSSDHAAINVARNNNIQASIDLGTINFDQVLEYDGVARIPVDVNVFIHQDYGISHPSPNTVMLELDRHEERLVPIAVDVFGTPAEGFEERPYTHSPRVVRLTGARSVLNEVSDVRVRVYINGASYTVEEPRPLVVYNYANEDMTNTVNLSMQSTHVVVPIFPYTDIPLRVRTIGTAMPGFMATEINIYPSEVSVVGDMSVLEEVTEIILGDIDVNLASSNIEQTFDIRQALIGTGLSLRSDAFTEATVDVIVERVISRDMLLPLERLTVSGYVRPFTFAQQGPVTLTLRGRESVINALTLNQLRASVDLTGLGAGAHTVQVSVVTPPRAALTNLVTVDIVIEPEPLPPFEPEEPLDWTAALEEEEEVEEEETE